MQLAFSTADELFALLERTGEALDYREAWPHLFPITNCPPDLMHLLVDDIVRNDERFAWESDVHVALAAWRAERHDLGDVAFTIVDLETTGATPGFAKITEIGAVRLEHGKQVGVFSQLVNPHQPISAMITSLTGISDEMVRDAPFIDEVLPRFVEFSAGSVMVAHNARFDLGFLDYELSMLMRCTFPRPALDTLRLARRLCPGQRCSLGALAQRFDTRVKPVHRALDDALATAELLQLFLARLEEQGLCTLEEVARFCEPGARRNYHKITLTEALPTTSGVYIMRDAVGHALYIGKAENLRRRTRDHFMQRQAHGARQALELLDRFEIVETGSEFAALLIEGRLIARHRPMYNQHGTRVRAYNYVKLTADEYPRVYATPNLKPDGGVYAGPFRRASFAKKLADCLNALHPLRTCSRLPKGTRSGDHACLRAETGACLAPCREPLNGEYTAAVAAVRRVLEGDGAELDLRLREHQAELVRDLAFELAGKLQEQRETLAQAMRSVSRLREALASYAVLAYPARHEGRLRLFIVAAGKVVDEIDVTPARFDEAAARRAVEAVYEALPPALPLPPDAIDELLLVHGWLRHHRADVHVLNLPVERPYERELGRLAAELAGRIPLCAAGPKAPEASEGREASETPFVPAIST
jgi:DNA polymerase-3 subunit epsilon